MSDASYRLSRQKDLECTPADLLVLHENVSQERFPAASLPLLATRCRFPGFFPFRFFP